MQSLIRTLTIILVAQLALAGLLSTNDHSLTKFTAEQPLLSVSLENLDEMVITIKEKDQPDKVIPVKKEGGNWILPSYHNFPVAERKLNTLRDELFTVKKPYPVGSTKLAAKQFEVDEEKYQTRVEFKSGGKTVDTLYLGSSPAFKKVHARTASDSNSYSINFSNFELRGKENTWIDREYLKLDVNSIQEFRMNGIEIVRDSNKKELTLKDLNSETEELNSAEINELLTSASSPSFIDVLGQEESADYGLSSPILQYSVTTGKGDPLTYLYGKAKEENTFVLKVSNKPFFFKVSDYQVNKIKDLSRGSLVKAIEKKVESEKAAESDKSKDAPVGTTSTE